MASEALRILKDAPVQKNPKLFCDSITVRFPVESQGCGQSSPALRSNTPTTTTIR